MSSKAIVQAIFRKFGFEITRRRVAEPATDQRPVGNMLSILQDLSARGLTCKTILDVGAHKADWSRLAKQVFPQAAFGMIEPQVELKGYLDQFCLDFPGSHYFLGGAGAVKEKKTLTIWPDLAGSSFLPATDPISQAVGKQRTIEMDTIDRLLSKMGLPSPELIKLDIQGYELEALKGAVSTFGKTEVYILEVSLFPFSDVPGIPLFAEVVNFMSDRDYVVYDFPGFLRRPADGALGQCDICFVKQNSFLRKSNAWH